MSRSDPPRTTRPPALYRRIRYDTVQEAKAFERLAAPDVDGCREAFGALISRLALHDFQTGNGNGHDPEIVQLLMDLLQTVNRRVHRGPQDEASYQDERVALIEEFARCESASVALGLFMPALNRLLVALRRRETIPHLLVDRARSYIDRHYRERIFLSSVALELNVSPNYLSRVFRKKTGETLTCYIQTKRLEHARLLLAEGQHSISEIAYLVGYQHYRDFYRNFVKREKASPREVQRRLSGSRSRKAGQTRTDLPPPGSSVL